MFQKQKISSIDTKRAQWVQDLIKFYVKDVMKLLEAKVPANMILCGGGATVIKNFYGKTKPDTIIIDDIYCNASGYEVLTYNRLKK